MSSPAVFRQSSSASRQHEGVSPLSYYTLVASLPHLPAHFDVQRPPITWPRLEKRLAILGDEHACVLQQLTDFLSWDRQPLDRTEQEVIAAYDRLRETISNPLVLELVDLRIDIRTIVSGLRRRRDGKGPPEGVGRLVDTIRRNWQHPQFSLQRKHPWIEEFSRRMLAEEAEAAERLLLEVTWSVWSRMAGEYTFSFEAVLLYLARWSIVRRWTSRDAKAGKERFDRLIEETLGEYASLQF